MSQQAIMVKQQECTALKEQAVQLEAQLQQARQSAILMEQQWVTSKNTDQQANEAFQQECVALQAQLLTLQEQEQSWLQEKSALVATIQTQQSLWQQLSVAQGTSKRLTSTKIKT